MKSTGMVRPIDELGRIVFPRELRRTLDLNAKDNVEIFVDGNNIIMRKMVTSCTFCGNEEGLKSFKEKAICENCNQEIKTL